MTISPSSNSNSTYYGWWIVLATFLNLFFVVGIIFYGFPVFYPYFVESLGFTRAQVTQGFFLGFLLVGLPSGILAGTVIDRIGARSVILAGVGLVGGSMVLMGSMTRFWQFELLCITEVLGYVLARADRQSGLGCALVSRASRTRDGLCLSGPRTEEA